MVEHLKKREVKKRLVPAMDERPLLEVMRGVRDEMRALNDNIITLNAELEINSVSDKEYRDLLVNVLDRANVLSGELLKNQQINFTKILDWVLRIGMMGAMIAVGINIVS